MLIMRLTLGPMLSNIGFYKLFYKADFISLDIKLTYLNNVYCCIFTAIIAALPWLQVNKNHYIEDKKSTEMKCCYLRFSQECPKNCK